MRRRVLGILMLVAMGAIATVGLAHDRYVRGWAATIAGACVLTIVFAWLAGVSDSLSSSGRDLADFDD